MVAGCRNLNVNSELAHLAIDSFIPYSSECPKHTTKAGVAQLVEHLICNQRVGGSNPFAGSTHHSTILGVPLLSPVHRSVKVEFVPDKLPERSIVVFITEENFPSKISARACDILQTMSSFERRENSFANSEWECVIRLADLNEPVDLRAACSAIAAALFCQATTDLADRSRGFVVGPWSAYTFNRHTEIRNPKG